MVIKRVKIKPIYSRIPFSTTYDFNEQYDFI